RFSNSMVRERRGDLHRDDGRKSSVRGVGPTLACPVTSLSRACMRPGKFSSSSDGRGTRLRPLEGGGRRFPMANTLKAGCACGAVQLEITGDPAVQVYCHCTSCRGWLGAPIHAASLWPTPN